MVELEDAAERKAKTYSGGMKRRLELARALMTTPEVLFLDEPTLGLDPQTRARVWDYLRTLEEKGGLTLLMTTHYVDKAEELTDTVRTPWVGWADWCSWPGLGWAFRDLFYQWLLKRTARVHITP